MCQDTSAKAASVFVFAAFFLFSAILVLWHREIYGLETRSALFVRDMLAGGSLMVPHLYGRPYTDYPPLFFIIQYLFSLPVGHVTALSICLPSTLSATALILFTWWFTKRHLDGKTAFIAALALAALPEFWLKAQRATIDMLLALECGLAIVCLFEADNTDSKKTSLGFTFLACLSILAGGLTKGLIGLLLPFFCWFLYLLLQKRFMDILRAIPTWALIVLAGVSIEALFFFKTGGRQLIEQAASAQFLSRIGGQPNKPFYYYFIYLGLCFIPWLIWAVAQLSIIKRSADPEPWPQKLAAPGRKSFVLFLTSWSSGILIPYLISASRHGRYLLPAFLPLAILTAIPICHLTNRLDKNSVCQLTRAVFILSVTVGTLLLTLLLWDPFGSNRPIRALALLSVMAFVCIRAGDRLKAGLRTFFLFSLLLTYSTSATSVIVEPGISQRESARRFVSCTEKALRPGEEVVLFRLKPDKNGIKYALFSQAYPEKLLFAKGPEGLSRPSLPFILVIPKRELKTARPFLSGHVTKPLCHGNIHNRKVLSIQIISSKN